MPRECSLCSHERANDISRELLSGIPYREIARRYSLTIGAISMHLKNHVQAPVRRIVEAERRLRDDAVLSEPVLRQLERLNVRVERMLALVEAAKDYPVALQAAKEIRENMKVIGRITGEIPLAPVVAATAENRRAARSSRLREQVGRASQVGDRAAASARNSLSIRHAFAMSVVPKGIPL
jgi:hypothetical protein